MKSQRFLARATRLVATGLLLASPGQAAQDVVRDHAGSTPAARSEAAPELPFVIDGPPPPAPPAVVSRDEAGRVTIRAVRLASPLRVDGRLEEAFYSSVPPISDFIQMEPNEGAPASEKTELWIAFDRDAIYVSFRCWESQPDRRVANEMRRDSNTIATGNDSVGFIFDTFYDRRNSVLFNVNPLGGRTDGQITDGAGLNADWNPIWEVKTGRFEGGWTVELAIPFKSLRYRPGRAQVWGFNARRTNKWKNEMSHLTPVPNALGMMGLLRSSLAATLVGLDVPPGSKNLEIKPYVTADMTTDLNAAQPVSNKIDRDFGLDVKYGLTQNLTADFTYNTDFAQVEADEQQVNLTRFSLFFPEKREFFLENQGTFAFGMAPRGTGGDTPIFFYSRRIGLNQGRAVPIDVGGRLTGRVGPYSVGLLNIRTGEAATQSAGTGFSVLRLKRDILRKSSVGVMFTDRSIAQSGIGRNTAYGVDALFAFQENLTLNAYWARTRTEGFDDEDTSYRAQLDYAGDRYGVQIERVFVGQHFNPEIGFVRRPDMQRTYGSFRFSPRPRNTKFVRKYSWAGSVDYIENGAGRVETRAGGGEFAVELQNSDRFSASYSGAYEFLPRPFEIASGVILPIGDYRYAAFGTSYTFGQQRKLSGVLSMERGTFYSGHRTAVGVSHGRMNVAPQLSIEPTYSINLVELAEGSFTAHLAGSRATYTVTPGTFVSALVQYNSSNNLVTANMRLRWEYKPGSELFVVYNDERNTHVRGFPELANRALIVKINRLFRF